MANRSTVGFDTFVLLAPGSVIRRKSDGSRFLKLASEPGRYIGTFNCVDISDGIIISVTQLIFSDELLSDVFDLEV